MLAKALLQLYVIEVIDLTMVCPRSIVSSKSLVYRGTMQNKHANTCIHMYEAIEEEYN